MQHFLIQQPAVPKKKTNTFSLLYTSTFVPLSGVVSLNSSKLWFIFRFLSALALSLSHTHTHTALPQQESSLNRLDCGNWNSQNKLFVRLVRPVKRKLLQQQLSCKVLYNISAYSGILAIFCSLDICWPHIARPFSPCTCAFCYQGGKMPCFVGISLNQSPPCFSRLYRNYFLSSRK